MWECEFTSLKKAMPDRLEREKQAREQNINIRHALFGGRTEGFKSYYCCSTDQKIYYFDVVSLYPTVNALDPYATGFKNICQL